MNFVRQATSTDILFDALIVVVWTVCNLVVAMIAVRLAARCSRDELWYYKALDAAVISVTLIVILLTVLGTVEYLSRASVLAILAVICAFGPVLLRQPSSHRSPLLILQEAAIRRPISGLFWGTAFGTAVVYIAGQGLMQYPCDYDCMVYHMPLIDAWLQAESLYAPNLAANWFPAAGNELVGLWTVSAFSGDFLIAFNNIPCLIIVPLSTFVICRELQMPAVWSHLGAVAVTFTPVLFQQAHNASNDLAVQAYFLAAVGYSLRLLRTRHRTALTLASVTIGLLAGVKYFALGYAVVVATAIILLMFWCYGWRTGIRCMAAMAALCPVTGGYWYLRNWLETGAPLFPMTHSGPLPSLGYPSWWHSTFAGNQHPDLWKQAKITLIDMLGPLNTLAVCTMSLIPFALIGNLMRRSRSPLSAGCLFGGLVTIGSGLVWSVTPYSVEDVPGSLNQLGITYTPIRYGLCPLSASSLALLAIVWALFRNRALLPVAALTAVHAVQAADDYFSVPVLFTGFELWVGLALLSWLISDASRTWKVIVLVLATGVIAAGTACLSAFWHAGSGRFYARQYGSAVLGGLHSCATQERICVFSDEPFPFFGSRRQHVVVNPRFSYPDKDLSEFLRQGTFSIVVADRSDKGRTGRHRDAEAAMLRAAPEYREIEVGGRWRIFRVRP